MRMINRLLALAAALLMLCSCAAAEPSPDDVLATVNGTPITRASFNSYLSNLTDYYAYYGYDVTTPENEAYLKYLALDTLVQLALMDQKLVEMNVTLTEEELSAAQQEGRDMWVEDLGGAMALYGITGDSTESERADALVHVLVELEAMGFTEQGYIDDAVANARYIKLENLMMAGATVPEGEVEARYEALVEADRRRYADDAAAYESALQMNDVALMYGMMEYYTDIWYIPHGYRTVVHILLPVDTALLEEWADLQATYEEQQSILEEGGTIMDEVVTAEEVENARLAALATVQPQVDEINTRLANGESFMSLIPLYTTDPAMDEEAELTVGYQVHMDSIFCPPGYRDAVFTLQTPGEVAAPLLSDGGVYIICYVGDLEGGPVPLTDEVHAMLHSQLLEEAQAAQYQQTMDAWIAEAEIVYSEEAQAFMIFD